MFRQSLAFLLVLLCLSLSEAHFSPHPLSRIHVDEIQTQLTSGASITIDATILNGTGNTVTITWSNVGSPWPGNSDWIGVWSPKPADYTKTTPAKYKYVISDMTGSGSTDFWLLNMRDSYTVAYFTGGLEKPVLLAESSPIDFSNYHIPMHIHLAYTQDPTQMRVNWVTKQNSFPSVNYGFAPNNLNNSILRVFTTSFKSTDLCGHPGTTIGWRNPDYLHSALITGLTPNTQYFYQIGDESANSKSEILSFWSAPVQSPSTDVDFFMFGDLGQVEIDGSNEASMMDGSIFTTDAMQDDIAEGLIQTNLSAAVFHIGDISYARGFATLWEQFFYQIHNLTGIMPWMTCDGNHERDYPNSGSIFNGTDSGGECGVPYEKRFSMPTSALDDTWYSLNYGPIHFSILSTEHRFDTNSRQYQWLVNDLNSVNREQTPFLVVAGHRPMYIDSGDNSTNPAGDQSCARWMRDELEPLFAKYQVDVAFWGHHHSYQRTCSLYQGECMTDGTGTVHIVTGASGAGFSANIYPTPPPWIEYVEDNRHGYTRAHVRGNTMTLDFVSSIEREIIDTVTIQSRFPISESRRQQEQEQTVSMFDDIQLF